MVSTKNLINEKIYYLNNEVSINSIVESLIHFKFFGITEKKKLTLFFLSNMIQEKIFANVTI